METPLLDYSDNVLSTFRFQFCPMCKEPLKRDPLFDEIPRIHCAKCGWVQLVSDCICVISVVKHKDGLVVLDHPDELGAGLPGGIVEYGESPEEAALREVLEETGLRGKITRHLGWSFVGYKDFPGPTVYILFEMEAVGGMLRQGDEGPVKIYPENEVPPIPLEHHGSWVAWNRWNGMCPQESRH